MFDSSSLKKPPLAAGRTFDLVRVTHSKEAVDVCSNTIRSYSRRGLRLYRAGKATFFSKSELEAFIRAENRKVAVGGDIPLAGGLSDPSRNPKHL